MDESRRLDTFRTGGWETDSCIFTGGRRGGDIGGWNGEGSLSTLGRVAEAVVRVLGRDEEGYQGKMRGGC